MPVPFDRENSTSPAHRIPVIGLVGGVGSGKRFFAQGLSPPFAVSIIDADAIGHQVLQEPAVIQNIRQQFGPDVLLPTGQVDRKKVGALVFGTAPEARQARSQLEAIVHPRIAAQIQAQIQAAQAQPHFQAIILDAAILLETGWHNFCDVIVLIDTPPDQRLARVEQTRGWTKAQWERREASQLPLARKREAAHYVIDNSQSPTVAVSHWRLLFEQILTSFRSH